MLEVAASATDEDTIEEPNLWTEGAGLFGEQNEDPMEEEVETSEKKTTMISSCLSSLERMHLLEKHYGAIEPVADESRRSKIGVLSSEGEDD
ncbi:hypothetical protein AXG93_1855s1020 [Marchantia polymorpha subsp. ruderalis]|uniref:Uncharacterized protein n=1 Tax=Marchantia polymorpha subsp. ruderalis TaxID=1480154 RepID=A0A176VNF2_MARPO|nr:hypothetical protein AXG93_1855s1020 [Marchantia polymorpha subsp. ruderalis]